MRSGTWMNCPGGWVIGNFPEAILQTPLFEIAYKYHRQTEDWPRHAQKIATEYNFLLHGAMMVNDTLFNTGEYFIIEPMEFVKPTFLTDCELIVVKIPSLPDDKILDK